MNASSEVGGSGTQRSGHTEVREPELEEELDFDGSDKTSGSFARPVPTPKEICRGLDEYVIGQRNVKIALSVGVYSHYKRIRVSEAQAAAEMKRSLPEEPMEATEVGDGGWSELNLSQFGKTDSDPTAFCEMPDINRISDDGFGKTVEDCELDKSNIIIIGPTGSGKTLLVETLARLIDVPLVITDATSLTQAGYVGEDVESILFKVSSSSTGHKCPYTRLQFRPQLYLESGQDLERCERGIVYIDESDKIRKSGGNVSISRDVSGEGVQHSLLKIVEGNVINVPKVSL